MLAAIPPYVYNDDPQEFYYRRNQYCGTVTCPQRFSIPIYQEPTQQIGQIRTKDIRVKKNSLNRMRDQDESKNRIIVRRNEYVGILVSSRAKVGCVLFRGREGQQDRNRQQESDRRARPRQRRDRQRLRTAGRRELRRTRKRRRYRIDCRGDVPGMARKKPRRKRRISGGVPTHSLYVIILLYKWFFFFLFTRRIVYFPKPR